MTFEATDVLRLMDKIAHGLKYAPLYQQTGRVQKVVKPLIRATLPDPHIGEIWELRNAGTDGQNVLAEVIGLDHDIALLTTIGDVGGLSNHTEVVRSGRGLVTPVGDELRGRILDALGRAADGAPLQTEHYAKVDSGSPDLKTRRLIDKPISVGVPAIDGFLTCGEGQRVGIFGSAGTGKSSLLASIVKNCDADIIVVALIGERGREVAEFVERQLGEEGFARAVVVCATAERPPMERVKAAHVATTIAEHFRDEGKRVLLLVDSVTRFARALREIGLAAGEPPARRGFPPSVFATMPALFERAGRTEKGSITAFYTVLIEDEETSDPIGEEVRSLLDGHIVLSRKLAESGHFPAIDVLASISRVMREIVDSEHQSASLYVRQLMSCFQENELLIRIGEYEPGSDGLLDEAVEKIDLINDLLQRDGSEPVDLATTRSTLLALAEPVDVSAEENEG